MKKNTKEEVKDLWKLCFNDSEAFVDLYFKLRYREEQNLVIEQDGKVISALQMLPYPLTFCQGIVPTSYVSGACTHPDYRKKGLMKQLLTQAFARMYEQGCAFSTLIPAGPDLFHYYAQVGYASCFTYTHQERQVSSHSFNQGISIHRIENYQKSVYYYLNEQLKKRPCCIQHTIEDFRILLEDLKISRGLLLTAQQETCIVGIALAYRGDNKWEIQELFADTPAIREALIHTLGSIYQEETIGEYLPAVHPQAAQPLGMARIIQAQAVLQRYAQAFPQVNEQFQLIDEQLPANNGFYRLNQGVCAYSQTPMNQTSINEFPLVHIHELTERILTPLHPYMSLMMN